MQNAQASFATQMKTPMRFDRVADLENASALSKLLGRVASVSTEPLTTVGFTTARHRRIVAALADGGAVRLVVKTTSPRTDWTALRSGDARGREAALLSDRSLSDVWRAFASPYVAYVESDDEIAVLMHDVSAHLLPDVREPVRDDQEVAILNALARLHALYWNSASLPSLLAAPRTYASLVGPTCLDGDASFNAIPEALRRRVHTGWSAAFKQLPQRIVNVLRAPPDEIAASWMGGPITVIHGDSKVANVAVFDDGSVAAFDWALAGAAPAAVELGWYVAVNATRLVGSKDETLARYRMMLAAARGADLSSNEWRTFNDTVVMTGAIMCLWAKALALDTNTDAAKREWDWWVSHLLGL